MLIIEQYKGLTDKELVNLIVKNNHEAVIYLLYHKCYKQLRSIVIGLFKTDYYVDDMIGELYVHLKGIDNSKESWRILESFKGESSLTTWLFRVATNLFIEKRKKLIDFPKNTVQFENNDYNPMDNSPTVEERMLCIALYDTISRLDNPIHKLVLLLELQGFSPKEIAEELTTRIKCNTVTIMLDDDKDYVDTAYVYNVKKRALAKVAKTLKMSTNGK